MFKATVGVLALFAIVSEFSRDLGTPAPVPAPRLHTTEMVTRYLFPDLPEAALAPKMSQSVGQNNAMPIESGNNVAVFPGAQTSKSPPAKAVHRVAVSHAASQKKIRARATRTHIAIAHAPSPKKLRPSASRNQIALARTARARDPFEPITIASASNVVTPAPVSRTRPTLKQKIGKIWRGLRAKFHSHEDRDL
jgi:hypothetical protein